MTGSRSVDYWSLQGARVLLAPYDRWDSRIPDDSAQWQRRLFPLIPWQLPSVVSECSQALALFHTEEQLDAFFCEAMGGGSGSEDFLDFFPLLARHCVDHLKEAHSPLWTPSR